MDNKNVVNVLNDNINLSIIAYSFDKGYLFYTIIQRIIDILG